MNLKRKWLVLLILGILFVAVADYAEADDFCNLNQPDRYAVKAIFFILGMNDLTADQLSNISVIQFQVQKQYVNLDSQMKILYIELNEIMNNPSPSMTDVKNKLMQINDIDLKLSMVRFEELQKLIAVLTPEQKKNYNKFMADLINQIRRNILNNPDAVN